jgi:hypothetical protein
LLNAITPESENVSETLFDEIVIKEPNDPSRKP